MAYNPTFSRDRRGKWPAEQNTGVTQVVVGSDAYIMEDEFNLLQWIQNEARADLVRAQSHSGVVDYGGSLGNVGVGAGSTYAKGSVATTYLPSFVQGVDNNTFDLTGFSALLNGYRINVITDVAHSKNLITLPAPPTFGRRDDLVFLEAWFQEVSSSVGQADTNLYNYGGVNSGTVTNDLLDSRIGAETTRRMQLRWRIRSVAGVDFTKYSIDGLVGTDGSTNVNIFAQGAMTIPTTNILGYFYNQSNRAGSGNAGRKVCLDDLGLYVAGDGTTTSQTALGTADGYVYAIPLFRVKRRNNAGYREDNLDGARDYVSTSITVSSGSVTGVGQTTSFTVASSLGFQVGDAIWNSSVTSKQSGIITAISGNVITLQITGMNSSTMDVWTQNQTIALVSSGRPDGKYSNIIDADDIIDLRHKVFNQVNYELEMQRAFDQLLRGQLRTLDTQTMAKNRYGLRKAPNGLAQELSPFTFVGDDGVSRDLVNILGSDGDCENVLNIGGYANVTPSLDSSNGLYGQNAIKLTSTNGAGNTYKSILSLIDPSKYYVVMANVKNGNLVTGIELRVEHNNTMLTASTGYYGGTSYTTQFVKVQPSDIAGATTLYIDFFLSGAIGQYAYVDGIRLYQIDQATYNKIGDGVTTGFQTGSDLANKFPYVSSYPNLVENLVPPFNTLWESNAIYAIQSPYAVKATTTAGYQNLGVTLTDGIQQSTQYTLSCVTDSTNVYISRVEKDSSGNTLVSEVTTISTGATGLRQATFTTHTSTSQIILRLYVVTGSTTANISNLHLERSFQANPWVPFGRWYLPNDYANGKTQTKIGEQFLKTRKVISDAQMADTVTETIEALMTPQRHVTVTQATAGTWAVGDKFTINSDYGVISGVIDSDTALAKILSLSSDGLTVTLDDVSKLSVNDTFIVLDLNNPSPSTPRTVQSIDTTNKAIVVNTALSTSAVGQYLVETTASTSSPAVTCAGIAGTWTNLGTKSATYTLTTAPTTPTSDIGLSYSVNYPAGKGIQYVPTNVLGAKVNGEDVNDTGLVSVKANFAGKVAGNTDLVAHTAKGAFTSGALPGNTSGTEFVTGSNGYSDISVVDGTSKPTSTTTSGQQSSHVFQFNLIRAVEDKFGEIPGTTTADKLAWLNSNLSSLTFSWTGYGVSPNGNKAYLNYWSVTNSSWVFTVTNTASTPSTISNSATPTSPTGYKISDIIDSNGFAYVITYADASDGTTASTIYTDYVELQINLNVAETGYTVLQPANKFPVLSENLLKRNQALPIDSNITDFQGNTGKEVVTVTSDKGIKVVADGTSSAQGLGIVAKNVVVNAWNYFTAWIYSDTDISNMGMTFSTASGMTFDIKAGMNKVQYSFKPTEATHNIVIYKPDSVACTFYYVKGVHSLLPNPKWTEGRRKTTTLNYLGKVAGSTFENPSNYWTRTGSSFYVPSQVVGTTDVTQSHYTSIGTQDGSLDNTSSTTSGTYAQQLYEFDLSHFGLSLKELKNALRTFNLTWVGYGSGDNAGVLTNGATVKGWRGVDGWQPWVTNTTGTPSTLTENVSSVNTNWLNYITNDQKVYVLVHSTYPASATNPSNIYTDYVKLDVTLADYVDYKKTNIVKVRPETKEAKLVFPAKSYRYVGGGAQEDVIDLMYQYVPYQANDATIPGSSIKGAFNIRGLKGALLSMGTGAPAYQGPYFYGVENAVNVLNTADVANLTVGQLFTQMGYTSAWKSRSYYDDNLPLMSPQNGANFGYSTNEQFINPGAITPSDGLFDSVATIRNIPSYYNAPCNLVFMLYGLMAINNEVLLVVRSEYIPQGNIVVTSSLKNDYTKFKFFKLQGRPLVKGVN